MNIYREAQPTHERILRLPEVCQRLGVGTTTIWRWAKQGTLIPPVRIGQRSVGWRESDLNDWIKGRQEARR